MMENSEESISKSIQFMSFPAELLVYIISFLTTTRDKVKLRYVSRRLRVAVSETPSLWNEFVWPLYDRREERSVMNVLKTCGDYIKRLTFPDHVAPSILIKMLRHCNSLTQLSLPPETKFDSKQFKLAVQHMESLEKLEIQLSTDIEPLLQIGGLKELTVHVVIAQKQQTEPFCISCVQIWIGKGFVPSNLNIVTHAYPDLLQISFLESWIQWNTTLPMGHTACLKLYENYRSTLNLSPIFPMAQLDFSQTATMPFVKASSFGLLGLENNLVLLTSSVYNGKAAVKAKIVFGDEFDFINDSTLNTAVTDLSFVTDFNFALCESLHSGHLEQLAIACPNLQRLNLEANDKCLRSLKGLRKIALHCNGLHGLNLRFIPFEVVESHEELWEILSDMKKLTYLALKLCLFGVHVTPDVQYSHKISSLFHKFSSLQGLEFHKSSELPVCCECIASKPQLKWVWLFLSYFPSLRYCNFSYSDPDSVQDIIAGCKELRYLSCSTIEQLSLSSACNSNLKHLSIFSPFSDVSDIFLETVSAHGGLSCVVLSINSVTSEGITILIVNSRELLTLAVSTRRSICDKQDLKVNLREFKTRMKKKFSGQKLFNVGRYKVMQNNTSLTKGLGDYIFDDDSDLLSLWY